MTPIDLLIVDPQNDFMDIDGAALPVPGAQADMQRLAKWLHRHAESVQTITVTLDSHASVGIERTTFWLDATGQSVKPFTLVTATDVQAGTYRPRVAERGAEALAYLQALESSGKCQLIVWPVHCVTGTWGHNLQADLSQAIAHWELQTGRTCDKVLKGQHPMTEQYSAFRAEVPRADDSRTGLNLALIQKLAVGRGTLAIAGEALSHCVAASVQDLMDHVPEQRLKNTVLLTDCMSPVTGFEDVGAAFLQQARDRGIRCTAIAALT